MLPQSTSSSFSTRDLTFKTTNQNSRVRAVQGQPKEVLGFLKAAVPCDGAG